MEDKILSLINKKLSKSDLSTIPFALKGGKLVIGLFWAMYSEETKNLRSRKKATEVLYDTIDNLELLSDTLLYGKMGVGWSLCLLSEIGVLEVDYRLKILLNNIYSLSSYSLYGHPFQLSVDEDLFSKGIYKLKQRLNDDSLIRYIIDEELIVFVDECENLLLNKIEHIYCPNQLSLCALNSILYFLREIEHRKIFPFKARLLMDRIYELYSIIRNKPLVDDSVYQVLSQKKTYHICWEDRRLSEKMYILGELGFYSLLYEDSRIFEFPFQQLKMEEPNYEKNY